MKASATPFTSSLRRCMSCISAMLLTLFVSATAAHAGTWSFKPWTGDGTTDISPARTIVAYHFGETTTATVNGVSVPGSFQSLSSPLLDMNGSPTSIFGFATNNLTALGGTGSALLATAFNYNGVGGPMNVTAKGLTIGQVYTVSFYGVGFDLAAPRAVNFSSGGDTLLVNQNFYGYQNGIRVDYTFTATATTRAFTLMETVPFYSWGLSAVAVHNGAPTSAPTVTLVTPANGTTAGGTVVTITGTNFVAPAAVTIGGTAATGINVVNATTITCTTPAHAAGAVSVLVTNPGGTNAANSLFTYVAPAPEIVVFDGIVTDPQLTDNTGTQDFGSVNTGSSSTAQTFTIRNDGTADLTGIAVTKAVIGNPGDFTVNTAGMLTTLTPNATTTFTVTFSPTAAGARSAVVQIASNDGDENPFRINVGGTGVTPVSSYLVLTPPSPNEFGGSSAADAGVGVERGVIFDALSSFSISSVGIEADPFIASMQFEAKVYSWSGVRGSLLATNTISVTDSGQVFYDVPLSFNFTAGQRYEIVMNWPGGANLSVRFFNFDPVPNGRRTARISAARPRAVTSSPTPSSRTPEPTPA